MSNSILMANFAVLLVSAQENEFKAGFSLNAETGIEGSTRQHLKMIRGSRCSNIIIAINKMDLVDWS